MKYEFNTYKILDQEESKLRADPNPFAVVALTVLMALKHKNIRDEGLKEMKIDLVRELIKRNLDRVKREKIMAFLAYYVNFEKPEMMIKFEEEVEQLTGRVKPMGVKELLLERRMREGIEIGLEKGMEQGSHQKALKIATELKREGLDLEFIAKTTMLSIKEIEEL